MSDFDSSTDPAADAQLQELLDAYAASRLTPAGPVLARMRAAMVAQAAASAAASEAERRRVETERRRGAQLGVFGRHVPRRAFALGLAATLTLGTGAAVLAAPPGSPLYGTRIAIENAFLPNAADARLAAHEQLIEQRLAEAQAAAARGDTTGLEAALDAYQAEVDAAVNELGDDAGRLAHLEDVLGNHVAVLQTLETTVADQAAIQHAIAESQKAVQKLQDKGGRPAAKPTQAPPHPTRPPSTDAGAAETQSGAGAGQQ